MMIRQRIKALYQASIKRRYLKLAWVVGDMESYLYMGVAVGYEGARNALAKWTRIIRKHGYTPLTQAERINLGGYSVDDAVKRKFDVDAYWILKREKERPND